MSELSIGISILLEIQRWYAKHCLQAENYGYMMPTVRPEQTSCHYRPSCKARRSVTHPLCKSPKHSTLCNMNEWSKQRETVMSSSQHYILLMGILVYSGYLQRRRRQLAIGSWPGGPQTAPPPAPIGTCLQYTHRDRVSRMAVRLYIIVSHMPNNLVKA